MRSLWKREKITKVAKTRHLACALHTRRSRCLAPAAATLYQVRAGLAYAMTKSTRLKFRP